MIQEILDVAICLLALVFIWTQLMWPMIRGTKLFPAFRHDVGKAEEKVVEAQQEAEIAEMELTTAQIKSQIKTKNKTNKRSKVT